MLPSQIALDGGGGQYEMADLGGNNEALTSYE